MYLTRNEQERCVMARIMRHGKMHQRNFTLKRYKIWDEAEKPARRWVKRMLRVLPPKIQNQRGRMTRRNHSGIVGVCKTPHIVRKANGQEYEYWRWTANWPGCPNRGGLSWYVSRFGDDDAFVLAALSLKMESINRGKIINELEKIRGSEYERILKLKGQ